MRVPGIAAALLLAMGVLSLGAGAGGCAEPVAEPAISVSVAMPGADAGAMATRVTAPLENALAGLDGLAFAASFTRAGESRIVLKLEPARDAGAVIAAVRARAAGVRAELPADAEAPVVSAFDRAAPTVAYLAFSSEALAPATVTEAAEKIAKDRLPFLVGVAEVRILGARRRELRLRIDGQRLEASGVSLAQVQATLRLQGVELRSVNQLELAIASRLRGVDAPMLMEVVLAWRDGVPIRLRDVSQVMLGIGDDGIIARFDRRPAVILEISKRREIDVAEVTRGLRDHLPAMLASLPAGTTHRIGYLCARCASREAR
jgi:multidrug efflux pump